MANAAQFTITITALDRATATFQRVNRTVNNMVMPFRNVGASITALGQAAGITQLASAVENAGSKVVALGSHISGLLGPLAAIGTAATVGGLFEIVKSGVEWGHQLSISSQKTGVAVDALARLHYVASVAGVGVDQMDTALMRLNRSIAEAASGKNKTAAAYFQKMHISLWNANHTLRDAASIFPQLNKHFAANSSIAQKTAAAMALLGRGGAQLLPVLDMTAEKFAGLNKAFREMYGPITGKVIAQMDEGEEAFGRMHLAVAGLKFTLASALLPIIEPLLTGMTKWVAVNRKLITSNIQLYVKKTVDYLKGIDWKAVGNTVMSFGNAIAFVGKVLGPVWSTVAVAGIVFSPLIVALGQVAVAMTAVIVRLGLMVFSGLISSIITVIPMIRTFRDLWIALDLVMDANPIALTAIAILAIGAAGYYAYTHFKPFHDLVNNKAWPIVVNTWSVAINGLAAAIERFSAAASFGERYLGWIFGGRADLSHLPADIGRVFAGKSPQKVAPAPPMAHSIWDPRYWDFWNNPPSPAPRNGMGNRAADARGFFQSKGWSPISAAAITGNLMWEGGLNPTKRGDHGTAYGIAQWHRARAMDFARVMHKQLLGSSLTDQLGFVNYELSQGAFKNIGAMLRNAKSLAAATGIVNSLYERPAAPGASQPQRLALASQALIAKRSGGVAGSTNGKVDVSVDIKGLPRGSKVTSKATGPNPPQLDTGFAWAY